MLPHVVELCTVVSALCTMLWLCIAPADFSSVWCVSEFLLPCLIASALSLLSSLSSALVLPETLPRLVADRRAHSRSRTWARRSTASGPGGGEEKKMGGPAGDVESNGGPQIGGDLHGAAPEQAQSISGALFCCGAGFQPCIGLGLLLSKNTSQASLCK